MYTLFCWEKTISHAIRKKKTLLFTFCVVVESAKLFLYYIFFYCVYVFIYLPYYLDCVSAAREWFFFMWNEKKKLYWRVLNLFMFLMFMIVYDVRARSQMVLELLVVVVVIFTLNIHRRIRKSYMHG